MQCVHQERQNQHLFFLWHENLETSECYICTVRGSGSGKLRWRWLLVMWCIRWPMMDPGNYLCKLPLSPVTFVMAFLWSRQEADYHQKNSNYKAAPPGSEWPHPLWRMLPSHDDPRISVLSISTASKLTFAPLLLMKVVFCWSVI